MPPGPGLAPNFTRMRSDRGFTLLEAMVVLVVTAIVAAIVVWQGRSARQNASLASGAYELTLRIAGLKGQAMADGRDYVLVVFDTTDPNLCVERQEACGHVLILQDPQPGFTIQNYAGAPGALNATWIDEDRLPRNSQFDLASTWRPFAPFNAVQAFDPAIRATCAGGRACFAIRFRATGEVSPEFPAARVTRAGFAFVLRPVTAPSAAADRRAIFVSFPAGIVKTAAF